MTAIEPTTRYSDEWLDWAAQYSPSRGERHSARYLARVPFEHRQRAKAIAWSIMNRVGTIYSDAVWSAVQELHSANYGETVTERQNREWREREQERRQAEWEREVRLHQRAQAMR